MRKYKVKKSSIKGNGLFSTENLEKDEIIGLAVEERYVGAIQKVSITNYLGIWVNHSEINPNTALMPVRGGWALYALKNIPADTELVANYRDAPIFIKRPEDYAREGEIFRRV